jgi:hypothetical protein
VTEQRDTLWAHWLRPSSAGSDHTDWIDAEYLPAVRALPGAALAERLALPGHDDLVLVWPSAPTAEHDAMADLDARLRERCGDDVAPESGRYTGRSARGGRFDAPALLCVRLRVQDGTERAARDWLDEEHAPRQLDVPGVLTFHGFESTRRPHVFLNLWGMADPHVLRSAAWSQQRDTPWMRRFWTTVSSTMSTVYPRAAHAPVDTPIGPAGG